MARSRVDQLDQALNAARDDAKAEIRRSDAAADERYRALEESYSALESRHDAIDQALEQAKQERDQLRSRLEQSRTETDDFHRKTLADARIISELEADLEKIKSERDALTKRTQRDKRHLASMTKMLAAQISKVVDLRLHGSVAEKGRQNASATIQSPVSRSLAAEARVAELDQALTAARTDAEALQAKHVEEKRARQAAESYNQELLSSTSWRITAPLRQVMQKLRGN